MAHGPELFPVCLLSSVPFPEQSALGPGKPLCCGSEEP